MRNFIFIIAAMLCAAAAQAQSLGEIAGTLSESAAKGAGEAVEDIEAKAKAGDAKAQLAIGSYYAIGERGLPKDAQKAVYWLEKSAAQKDKAAMVYLGYIYGEGKLVKRDFQKAVLWREAAAEIGDSAEKWSLGNAFLYGFRLPKDQQKALFWITRAAEGGNAEAVEKLIEIHENLGNAQELEKWNSALSKMQLEAAQAGNALAMLAVAEKFMSGKKGLPRRPAQAVFWYKKAADAGNREAMEKLAKMYARGRFLPKNPEKAQEYLEKLAAGDPAYCFKIASLFGEGKDGFPKDEKRAADWYAKGAEKSDITTRLFAVFRYWRIGETQIALKLCGEIEAQSKKSLAVIEEKAPDGIQAMIVKQTLKNVERMRADISGGKPAPENTGAYLNGKPTPN